MTPSLTSKFNNINRHNQRRTFLKFCWACISIYACNETNLTHYLSSVYWVTIPLHVSGFIVAHHQEVAMYCVTIGTCCIRIVMFGTYSQLLWQISRATNRIQKIQSRSSDRHWQPGSDNNLHEFAYALKASIISVMSVRMHQLGPHWMNFRKFHIWDFYFF
jgi:hypothetical protein